MDKIYTLGDKAVTCLRETLLAAAMTAVCLLSIAGCVRRPLEDPDSSTSMQVVVNINAISNVTTDIYNEKIHVPKIAPEMMHVLFYDISSEKVVSESFISGVTVDDEGHRSLRGNISIDPGVYKMLIYNFDTQSTTVRHPDNFKTIEAYTNRVSSNIIANFSRVEVDNSDNIVYQPDHLVVASSESEHIPFHSGTYTITTEAKSIVESYYLQIKVDGLEYVSSAQAVLTGMVGSNLIGDNVRVYDPPATVYFTLEKSDDKGNAVLAAVFNTFGRIEDMESTLSVTFDIRTVDGRVIKRDFDITPLFYSDDCINRHWLLFDETITIDPPKSTGGGFDPSVDEWEDEDHEIIM